MDIAGLIRFAIAFSMMLLVFALGLRASPGDAMYLFRRPALLARSLLAMSVVLPALVVWLVSIFDLKPAVEIALVALAISPVPPFLPGKQLRVGGDEGFVCGLFFTAALLSIVLVPLTMALIESTGVMTHHVTAGKVLAIVATTVLVPLLLGMGASRLVSAPVAKRIAAFANVTGAVLLVMACVPVVIAQWPAVRSLIGDGTLLAIVSFTILGLIVGHVLGGPDADDRSVLSLATAARHPAVAMAIASASFPEEKLVPAAVLLALVAGTLASAPYTAWRKRLVVGPTSN